MAWPEEIARAPKTRLTRSRQDSEKNIIESPVSLLAQCNAKLAQLGLRKATMNEMALARNVSSEHGSGSPQELAAIADVAVNRGGNNIFEWLTAGGGRFGRQGGTRPKKPASTRQDPTVRSLVAARVVLRGDARGISKGARRYFDPRVQYKASKRLLKPASCNAVQILRRWTYSEPPAQKGATCPTDPTKRGGGQLQWIGPVAGIDPAELMLFQRKTSQQDARYEAALVICKRVQGIADTIEVAGWAAALGVAWLIGTGALA